MANLTVRTNIGRRVTTEEENRNDVREEYEKYMTVYQSRKKAQNLRRLCIVVADVYFDRDNSYNNNMLAVSHGNNIFMPEKNDYVMSHMTFDERVRISRYGKYYVIKNSSSGENILDTKGYLNSNDENDFRLEQEERFKSSILEETVRNRQLTLTHYSGDILVSLSNAKSLHDVVAIVIQYGLSLVKSVLGNVAVVGYVKTDNKLTDVTGMMDSSGFVRKMAGYIDNLEQLVDVRGEEIRLADGSKFNVKNRKIREIAQNAVNYEQQILRIIQEEVIEDGNRIEEDVEKMENELEEDYQKSLSEELKNVRRQRGVAGNVNLREIELSIELQHEKGFRGELAESIKRKWKESIANYRVNMAECARLIELHRENLIFGTENMGRSLFDLDRYIKVKTSGQRVLLTLTFNYEEIINFTDRTFDDIKTSIYEKYHVADNVNLRIVIERVYKDVDEVIVDDNVNDDKVNANYKLADLMARCFSRDLLYSIDLKTWTPNQVGKFLKGYYSNTDPATRTNDEREGLMAKRVKERKCVNFIVRLLTDAETNIDLTKLTSHLSRFAEMNYLWIYVSNRNGRDISEQKSYELNSEFAKFLVFRKCCRTITFYPTVSVKIDTERSGYQVFKANENMLSKGLVNNFTLRRVKFAKTIPLQTQLKLAELLLYQYLKINHDSKNDVMDMDNARSLISYTSNMTNDQFFQKLNQLIVRKIESYTNIGQSSIVNASNNGFGDVDEL